MESCGASRTCMCTRSGVAYKPSYRAAVEEATGNTVESETVANKTQNMDVSELVRILLEDRRTREDELTKERERREEAEAAHSKKMDEQLEMMRQMVSQTAARSGGGSPGIVETPTSATPSDKPQLSRFVEGDDIEAFLTTFERLMHMYHVEERRWVAHLAPQLSGRAQQAYAAMHTEDALVYSEVKKAILRRYDINEETYRQRFRAARRKEGEPYIELATRMADLFGKWTADCTTVEALSEKLLIEQLLNNMPADLRVWLSDKKPSTSKEAGRLADDYVLARKRNPTPAEVPTHDSRKQGTAVNRDSRRTCFLCGQPGHVIRNCPKKTSESSQDTAPPTQPTPPGQKDPNPKPQSERKCYNCHKRGHLANRCPNNALYCGTLVGTGRVGAHGEMGAGLVQVGDGPKGGGGVLGWCRSQVGDGPVEEGGTSCGDAAAVVGDEWLVGAGGEPPKEGSGVGCVVGKRVVMGHGEQYGCEAARGMVGLGQVVESVTQSGVVEGTDVHDIVLDTGCSRTMIQQDLVPAEKKVPGEAVTLRCAHGDVVLYPLADVDVQVSGITFTIRAAVSQTLPVSMLLGTDVPILGQLLGMKGVPILPQAPAEAMVVTRAQKQAQEALRVQQQLKEFESEVCPTPLVGDTVSTPLDDLPMGSTFSDDLFTTPTPRKCLTKKQKRLDRHSHGLERAKDRRKTKESDLCLSKAVAQWDLKRLQEEDTSLNAIRRLADEEPTSSQAFYRDEGLLYRVWQPKGQQENTRIQQLVLPKQCRQEILRLAHSIPLGGHLGRKKTFNRIALRFYWPNMSRDIANYCRSCETCQRFRSHKKNPVPLIPLPIVEEPFSRVAMDIVGPLPRSRSGNRYVLVLCDYGTKYPEAVPLRTIDAETIAEQLMIIFSRVGIPREILTDQGANFQSSLLQELYRLLHVDALRTSPYHPQTDGLVERFNQTLKGMLRKAAYQEGKDWDLLIPYLLFAYREVPQESTGFSPFEMLYGRDIRGPLDILKESWCAGKRSNPNVVAYILMMRDRLEAMAEVARKTEASAKERQKTWYDQTARERSFEPGEQVLVLLPSTTSKLTAQWQGPYVVEARVGKVNYKLRMPDRRKKTATFHVNMLQKWHTSADIGLLVSEVEPEEREDIPSWNDSGDGPVQVGPHLSPAQTQDLQALLEKYETVFRDLPGHTSLTEHHIPTDQCAPVRRPPYRIPQAFRDEVNCELQKMLEHGIIEHSTSDWASPLVAVQKKDGSLRLCVDYRRVNAISKSDAYPMPRVEDLIDKVGNATFISTLDLTKGYWQVPVASEDRAKTAFITPNGLYHFTRMPFGLQGAPATFQRMVDHLLDGLGDFAGAYLDDIIIFSTSWKEHMDHLSAVLERIVNAGLTVKRKKCQFAMAECVYLGHRVGSGKVRPEDLKIKAIQDFDIPITKRQVRSFLGLAGYYRKFIPHYSSLAAPLTDLTRKVAPNEVVWNTTCERAFQALKAALSSSPILQSPDFTKQFLLQTDASDRGVGAVLSQCDQNGQDRPVAYFSRKLLPREQRYSTIEKECLAIKLSVQAFHTYLMGRTFVIQTDHRALEWLDRIKDTNARLTRWSLFLQAYSFTVRYRAGTANCNADALSRLL